MHVHVHVHVQECRHARAQAPGERGCARGRARPCSCMHACARACMYGSDVRQLKRMRDGRMSFPSGHASMSNAGMSMIVHWIAGKLHTFSRHTDAWRLVTSLSPFTISMFVHTCIQACVCARVRMVTYVGMRGGGCFRYAGMWR